MSEKQSFDLVIIGGGPAGYVGAIRAAQLGMNVACVEMDKLGGVCLNWGCIPTKALLGAAEFYHKLKHEAADFGVIAKDVSHDWSKVISRSRGVAGNLNKGVAFLFKKNKITHIQGKAKVLGRDKVSVTNADGKLTHELSCKNVMVCTGAKPRTLPGVEIDGDLVISSKEAMSLPEQPKSMIIIGAGAIGMEFAYFYDAFGTDVTVIEMLDHLLPNEDEDVCKAVEKAFRKLKVNTKLSTKTLKVEPGKKSVKVTVAPVKDESKTEVLEADKVLMAIGVVGRTEGLFDDKLKVAIDRGHISVDKSNYQTNVPGIYAVGDVIGPPWLAHVASEEAIVCVEQIAGHDAPAIDYSAIPGCTYCQPQVASMGKTEKQLQADGLKLNEHYAVGNFPFQASGKAQALGSTQGFVKILSDKKTGEILGVHMVGEAVTELLAEMGLAKRLEATTEEVIATMHAHPTLSEAVHEAALGTEGRMIHF